MQLPEALIMSGRLIETGETHIDYKRTVELAETYRIFITGTNIEKKLIRYVQREDVALFDQRTRITKTTTPAVAASIRKPFSKVTRNNRIRKGFTIKNEGRKLVIDGMIKGFYGGGRKKSRGLEYWLKTRLLQMSFIDPNSWVVIEWDSVSNAAEAFKPRPFEVSSEMARNFFIVNDEVKWLFVKQDIKFGTSAGAGELINGVAGAVMPANYAEPARVPGYRYTLYDEDYTVVYEQIDPEYLKVSSYQMQAGEQIVEIKGSFYLVRSFQPNLGFAPTFRIGYNFDEDTDSRTFVNPWHDSLCFFEKSLKTVSELDLTMLLHTFPQKLQYVQKCKGTETKKCNGGMVQGTGEICSACKGQGYKVHTSAQDAILLPMPEDGKDMIKLDDLIAYKTPPIELIKFQNEYTQQLERQAHQAVFNSQVFIKKAGNSGSGSGEPIQTATEADFNMQSVYDALEPFTEKFSEIWREIVQLFAILSGENEIIEVFHDFPADYKLKSGDVLLHERKAASDSGAPAFLIETIDDDLASIVFEGDPSGLNKFRVKRRLHPFAGSTADEIAELLTSAYVPKFPKVLYSNFDLVFKEIEFTVPTFWEKQFPEQRALVELKVKELILQLEEETPKMTINTFREGGPKNNGGENGTEDVDELDKIK